MGHKLCSCETPTPWEDVKGKKTNMCRVCQGQIAEPKTDALGSVIIALQGTVGKLEFNSGGEREAFLRYMADGMSERFRQSLLTFRLNRAKVVR